VRIFSSVFLDINILFRNTQDFFLRFLSRILGGTHFSFFLYFHFGSQPEMGDKNNLLGNEDGYQGDIITHELWHFWLFSACLHTSVEVLWMRECYGTKNGEDSAVEKMCVVLSF
jgi:hypothetical protein